MTTWGHIGAMYIVITSSVDLFLRTLHTLYDVSSIFTVVLVHANIFNMLFKM